MTIRPARAERSGVARAPADLFAALALLRGGTPPARERDRAWLAVTQHVTRVLPAKADDDARQDALVAIVESVHRLRADTPLGAASWVRAVCRHEKIDQHRGQRRRRASSLDDIEPGAPPDPRVAPPELAHVVVDAFIERIDQHLAHISSPDARQRRRTQALAALYRTALDERLPQVAERLGLSVSLELLAKWIERGRAVIVATVEADRARDPDLADFFAPFADLALARRADAGLPRPRRRKSAC